MRGMVMGAGLFCLCAIMFFIGVLVGRGTAPVQFDTDPFQKELARLLHRMQKGQGFEKPEFEFYDVLKQPVAGKAALEPRPETVDHTASADTGPPAVGDGAAVPEVAGARLRKEEMNSPVPEKKSMKALSRGLVTPSTAGPSVPGVSVASPADRLPRGTTAVKDVVARGGLRYTIQVASFRQLADAIARMEHLKVKGLSPHRALAQVGGKLWHRVRVGRYPNSQAAENALKQLESAGIYGIIVPAD